MAGERTHPIQWSAGPYLVEAVDGGLPLLYGEYRARAALVEELDLKEQHGVPCCVAVWIDEAGPWPFLLVAQRHDPHQGGFPLGLVLLPETRRLFIGAGTRVLAYDVSPDAPRRLWENGAEMGFLQWRVHEEAVIMAAELEVAAWDREGAKLWSVLVEPPWSYEVRGGNVHLDVMGATSSFPLATGPERPKSRLVR